MRLLDVHNVTLRFVMVGGIAIALLLPLAMIQGLVKEREGYFHEAMQSVTNGWGNAQKFVGLLLVVPQRDSNEGWTIDRAPRARVVLVAQASNADIEVVHEIRQRGIFKVPVYVANVGIEGKFDTRSLKGYKNLDWSGAQIVVAISDMHGIRDASLKVSEQPLAMQALSGHEWLGYGLQADFERGTGEEIEFEFALSLRGSSSLSVIIPGVNTLLTMTSSWPHPSFRGRFLPDTLNVSEDGFSATWANHELSRGLPKTWHAGSAPDMFDDKGVTLDLYEPVSIYRSVERGVKYGVLFLASTFLTLLCFELSTGLRFHFVQYGAAGLAMLVFFLALLSLAEHLDFSAAYVSATLAMVSLTGWYVRQITRTVKLTAIFVSVLLSVYMVLYMLLRMEAYALVVGTVVLLAGLAALMWATRGLAESGSGDEPEPATDPPGSL